MFAKRTDLALEARELWQESAGTATKLAGVKAVEKKVQGYSVTRIDILDRRGEAALGKPVGSYRTLDLSAFWQRSEGFFDRAVRAVGQQLRELIPESGSVLVAGLGNAAMTPDAVGPLAADSVLDSRQQKSAREQLGSAWGRSHHPASDRRHAPAIFRLPPGGGAANRRTGRYRRGVR